MEEYNTKVCRCCGKDFPLTSEYFPKRKSSKGGFRNECKSCKRIIYRKWQLDNAERLHDYGIAWRLANPDKTRASRKRWRANNPDKVKEANRRSNQKHPETRRRISRKYRRSHPELTAQRGRLWRQNNKELVRLYSANRRALLLSIDGVITKADIDRQYASQNGNCWWCGNNMHDKYQIDHLIPITRGGHNKPSNIVISCPKCNRAKYNKTPDEFIGRLL